MIPRSADKGQKVNSRKADEVFGEYAPLLAINLAISPFLARPRHPPADSSAVASAQGALNCLALRGIGGVGK
jgi:hypothetical protein